MFRASRKKILYRAARREPSDRLSSIKTINLMNLKRIKGEKYLRSGASAKKRDEIVYMRSALRFQLIRNYVILIDLIRLISYFALIFRRPNYISICFRFFVLAFWASVGICVTCKSDWSTFAVENTMLNNLHVSCRGEYNVLHHK